MNLARTANLASILSEPAAGAGAPALALDGRTVSYGELDELARGVAALLAAQGVEAGDRVAIVVANGPAFAAAAFGVLWLGAIAVPTNILLKRREVAERLDAVEPKILIVDAEREDELGPAATERGIPSIVLNADGSTATPPIPHPAPPHERGGADPAVILFTSGTSGVSKGAILSHGTLRSAAGNAAGALGFTERDVVLGAAPFSHVLGLSTGLIATLGAGGCIALGGRFEPREALAMMAATGTTVLLGVPTMCIALCEAARSAEALPPLRLAHVGGAAVPVEVIHEFERLFGAGVYEGYGLTELSGIATTYREGQVRKPGSVGMPLGDTEVRIVSLDGVDLGPGEVGEVQLRGSTVIPGYWGAATRANTLPAGAWLATGDLGYLDTDGYLFLVDRLKELIIRGGYNVYPREIEEVLYAHPDVLEAVVVGVPHPTAGEEVVALVTLRAESPGGADAIREWVRERVAAYKYPRHVVVVDELPKGPTGKLLKRAIDREALGRSLPL